MFVLLDIEWIETENQKQEITQMAALRVDSKWNALEQFSPIIKPACLDSADLSHVSFGGYSKKHFQKGVPEATAIRRFSEWLREGDDICVWHHDSKELIEAAWHKVFRKRIPHLVICSDLRTCNNVQNGNDTIRSLYDVAHMLGIFSGSPYVSLNNVNLIRRLFECAGMKQKNFKHISNIEKTAKSLIEMNRSALFILPFKYFTVPGSQVFHTRDCPCLLRAKEITGGISYDKIRKKHRPCRVCNPQRIINLSPNPKPEADPPLIIKEQDANTDAKPQHTVDKTELKGEPAIVDYSDRIRVRLLGGGYKILRRGDIVGYCHNIIHVGAITKSILEEHDCLEKQCPFLERNKEAYFWAEQKGKERKRAAAKRGKIEKKAIIASRAEFMERLRKEFQACADSVGAELDVIRVELPNSHTYTLFYVSDNHFADGNRFPAFWAKAREMNKQFSIVLRHIKDVDGHFVTREEYYRKKR